MGLLAGPAAVGTLAGLTDLRTGFVAVIVLLGAAIAAGALVLPRMAGDDDPVRVRTDRARGRAPSVDARPPTAWTEGHGPA